MTSYSDFTTFSQDSIDTVVKANTAAMKGFEALAKHWVEFAGKSFEEAVDAGKKLAGAKSVVELVEMQSKLAQESFETLVEEGKTVSELSSSIYKDVTAPFGAPFKFAGLKPATTKKAA